MPILRYDGPVHVVAEQPDLRQAMQDILLESVVGFDTETRPAFRPGESYLPSIAQFATARAVYLVQVQQPDLFGALREILSSEKIIKVGVSVTDDVRNLKKVFEFDERSVVDLGKVAKRHGLEQSGVRNLAGIFLGARIPKGAKTTNWAAPPPDAATGRLRGNRCVGVPRALLSLQGTRDGLTAGFATKSPARTGTVPATGSFQCGERWSRRCGGPTTPWRRSPRSTLSRLPRSSETVIEIDPSRRLSCGNEALQPSEIGCLQDRARNAPTGGPPLWEVNGAEHDPSADPAPQPAPARARPPWRRRPRGSTTTSARSSPLPLKIGA